MALTADQQRLNKLYNKHFGMPDEDGTGGRNASFDGEKAGGNYWLNNSGSTDGTIDWDNIDRMLGGSDEAKKHRGEVEGYTKGNIYIGGIDPTRSIESQSGPGFWGDHFREGGTFQHQNAAGRASDIAKEIGHTPSEAYFNNSLGGTSNSIIKHIDNNENIITKIKDGIDGIDGIDGKDGLTLDDLDAWWAKQNQGGDKKEGMDDFMKFMMLMSVMRPGGGGGGGSQYGYGGLNPGGVQSAYNPWDNMNKGWDFMKTAFGSGSKDATTTALTNAT